MKRWGALVALVVMCFACSAAGARAWRSGSGIRVLSARSLDARLVALSLRSDAIPGPANVRILLPAAYASHPERRYPVLYLLHGTSGGAADWTTMGSAEQTTAGQPLIVVMPDIGLNSDGGGWCTNWVSGVHRNWETFHIWQLIPWVDANLRTIAARGGRAIAGLSQGGFCSMSYAARHPDLFGIALGYSPGVPDIAYDTVARIGFAGVLAGIEAGLDHVAPGSIFGPPLTDEINWAAHDPTTLAGNLRHTKLLLYTGNGSPGPLDPRPYAGVSSTEVGVHLLTQLFHQRLQELGIPSLYDDYGPGTHSWPYWARDLRQSLGPLMADFARGIGVPQRFSYSAVQARYSIYGWTVVLRRAVRELSTLGAAGAGGFTMSGSGRASVTTAPMFQRGARYDVKTVGAGSAAKHPVLRAGADGRLRVTVVLGPSNRVEMYPPSALTKVFTVRVTFGRPGR